ncbi:Ubiquinol-cytochrome c reductase complex 6.7 kDa protein [Bienertia sinuspersici]
MVTAGMFKFLKPSMRPHPTDVQAAVGWGVAAATGGLYLVQMFNIGFDLPWGWIKRTFIDKQEEEQ